MRRSRLVTALLMLLLIGTTFNVATAESPANEPFYDTWARHDKPIIDDEVARTWMWGPEAFTGAMTEPYAESPGGSRTVQYFDKARMEITDPDADQDSIWYVTNGLLVVELVTGEMQVGHDEYQSRDPAQVNVAGDAGDPEGPTYSTFASLLDVSPLELDSVVVQRLNRDGEVSEDPGLSSQDVTVAYIEERTNHSVAEPFWEFVNSQGTVWENDGYTTDFLFQDPFYATGLPITEPYWTEVQVGGTPTLVLVQCFERRCLTYTPDNPEGWQVEAGNVGQHYYAWRYEQSDELIAFARTRTGESDGIYLTDENGANLRQITTPPDPPSREPPLSPGDDTNPVWSPDGQKLAIERAIPGLSPRQFRMDLAVLNPDGTNVVEVAHTFAISSASWSPDNQQLVYWRDDSFGSIGLVVANADGSGDPVELVEFGEDPDWSPVGDEILYSVESDIGYVVQAIDPSGSEMRQLGQGQCPRWSPDGSRIAFIQADGDFTHVDSTDRRLMVANADGSLPEVIAEDYRFTRCPRWSPDGSQLIFEALQEDDLIGNIFVVDADGTEVRQLTEDGLSQSADWFPDGDQIVFTKHVLNDPDDERDDNQHIHIMNADGTNVRQITSGDVVDAQPAWRP